MSGKVSESVSNQLKLKGNEAFLNGEFKKAAKIYRDAIKLDPSNAILYSNRAISFIKLEDFERALKDCDSGLRVSKEVKTTVKLLYRKHLALVGLKRTDESVGVLREALKLDPTNKLINSELNKFSKTLAEQPAQKKPKTTSKDGLRQESHSNIINIDIQYVDELPPEFQLKAPVLNSPPAGSSSSKIQDLDLEELIPTKTTAPKPKLSQEIAPKVVEPTLNWKQISFFVDKHQSSKGTCPDSKTTLDSLLQVPFEVYQDIFNTQSRSGITELFLDFILDLVIQFGQEISKDSTLALLNYFSTCRRFSLARLLIDSKKIDRAEAALHSEGGLQSWR